MMMMVVVLAAVTEAEPGKMESVESWSPELDVALKTVPAAEALPADTRNYSVDFHRIKLLTVYVQLLLTDTFCDVINLC